MSTAEVRSLTFSTVNSNNSNPTNPTYFISPPITNINQFNVASFSGVNTIYNIDSRNNVIRFMCNAVVYTVAIPAGNYTITTFLTAISTAMSSASSLTFTATYSVLTNIITITCSTLTLIFLSCNNNLYYETGFSTLSTTFALSQVASSTYDISGLKQIHLISSDLSNYVHIIGQNYNVIASIPVSQAYSSVINFQPTQNFVSSNIQELGSCSFFLLDERMRPLTRMSDWSVTLLLMLE
jgi:hypothetical protein